MDKRRAHRVRVNLPARYRSKSISSDGQVSNLSCDGLFLRADLVDVEGTRVSLDLEIPGTDVPLRIDGDVVRTEASPRSYGMGIRFADVRPPVRLQLANYLLLRTSREL